MAIINLAGEVSFESNTTSGNVSLTRTQLQSLTNGQYSTGGVTISGSNILALDIDFGDRVAIQDIRYYFDSGTSSGTVLPTINFYYKLYNSDPWSSFVSSIGSGYYTTTSGNFSPQYIRVVHTISGTGITGTLREYEINSDDTIVDFGSDGSLTSKNIEYPPVGDSSSYSVPIFNSGTKSSSAYVLIKTTGTDSDELIKISDAQNGTFIGVKDGYLIDGEQEGAAWSVGDLNNTGVSEYKLELLSATISGTYVTPIVENLDPTYWRVKATIPENTSICTTSGALSSTIEIRSSDTEYRTKEHVLIGIIREDINPGYFQTKIINQNGIVYEIWDHDGGYNHGSPTIIKLNPHDTDLFEEYYVYVVYDNSGGYAYTQLALRIFSIDGVQQGFTDDLPIGGASQPYCEGVSVDIYNNAFVHCRRPSTNSKLFYIQTDGTVAWTRDLGDGNYEGYNAMDLDMPSGDAVWISSRALGYIRRVTTGNVVTRTISGLGTGGRGLCSDDDGGFWFVSNGSTVVQYDSAGEIIQTVSSVGTNLGILSKDGSGGFWAVDFTENKVTHVNSTGTILTNTAVSAPHSIAASPNGCWVLSDTYDRVTFVNNEGEIEFYTDDYTFEEYEGTNDFHLDTRYYPNEPDELDTHWGSSGDIPWAEVDKDNHFLPHKKYHQARITLRGDGISTPSLEHVCLVPNITLTNIGPQSYKTLYVKTSIPSGTSKGAREAKLRTWFDIE